MRWLIRSFFKILRLVIGPFLLLGEWLTAPKGMVRAPEAQARVDAACRQLALYQFRTCPFCIKVRQEMRRLSLPIELRDAQFDPQHRAELEQGGGRVMVPCLKITGADGSVTWLYESGQIKAWLQERFSA